MANIGILDALTDDKDVILSDELNHASIVDGCRISKANVKIYKHKDLNHLEHQLKESKKFNKKIIVTDSVFSMDGDIAPLDGIVALAEKYNAFVIYPGYRKSYFSGIDTPLDMHKYFKSFY